MKYQSSYRQELRETLDKAQNIIQGNVESLEKLWNIWLAGYFGMEENKLRIVLELLLFGSQNADGKLY